MSREIRIGTRASALALAQAEIAARALRRVAPGARVRLVVLDTAGDRDRSRPIGELGSGAFTTDLESALRSGVIDLAVHSTKDLPAVLDPAVPVRSVLRRADPREAIVSPNGRLRDLAPGSRVGTSSRSRTAQLRLVRPDLIAVPVRGPVDARLAEIGRGNYEAMLLAAAGLDRLNRGSGIDRLPPRMLLPAPGQGALALQIRRDDAELDRLVRALRHRPTWREVRTERAFLRATDRGADAPVAALAQVRRARLVLAGRVVLPDGAVVGGRVRGTLSGGPRLARRLARRLQGATAFR